MKHLYSGALALFAAGCLPIGQPDQVIVDGEAALEFQPEIFSISVTLRSRHENQGVVLAEISDQLSTIRETMPNLEGLTHLTIDASQAEISPVQDRECLEKAGYRQEGHCPVMGYFGSVSLSVTGSPAKSSGHALSLLSELGAESVQLSAYSLADIGKARQDAIDAAVKDARLQAESIAAAAGASLAGPIRIQYGKGFADPRYDGVMDYDQAVYSPSAVRAPKTVVPQTDLDLDPQPIRIEAKIVAAFEIE